MSRTQGPPRSGGLNIGPVPAEGNPADEALAALGGARGMVQTRTDYQTAVHVSVPRVLKDVEKGVLEEAAMCGEDFIYSWEVNDKNSPTGKSVVEGLSIGGAMIMMSNWTNCGCPTELVDETPTHFLLKSTFIDLEKGVTFPPRLFRQRKNQRTGGMDVDRAQDLAFQIGQSKCQRNAIDKAMPQWLTKRAMDAAKMAAERRYEDVPKAVAEVRKYAARLGITDAELEKKIGSKFADWLPRDLVYLRTVFRAIADKQTSITIEFRNEPAPPEETSQAPADEAQAQTPPTPATAGPVVEVWEQRAAVSGGPPLSPEAADAAISKALADINANIARVDVAEPTEAPREPTTPPEQAKPADPPPPAVPPPPDFSPPITSKKKAT